MRLVAIAAAALLGVAATAEGQGRRCGLDRWPVKTLADGDTGHINWAPEAATVEGLGKIKIPEIPYPNAARMAPHERQVYRVRAVVAQILDESDGDWHLILESPEDPSATMIAEIPSPECAASPAHAALYLAARDALRRTPRRGTVLIEGLGFFDFIHNQRGRARNGFELHPVLTITRSP